MAAVAAASTVGMFLCRKDGQRRENFGEELFSIANGFKTNKVNVLESQTQNMCLMESLCLDCIRAAHI